ncbi:MAG: CopG family transcriptional regulator [Methanococci archaeon]|nr:CopG family transcriptional regulator [Methanococci archaeon]
MRTNKGEVKRIQVTFTKEQWELIEKLKGELGLSDSEVVRNIVLNWLIEKSFISTALKNRLFRGDDNGKKH